VHTFARTVFFATTFMVCFSFFLYAYNLLATHVWPSSVATIMSKKVGCEYVHSFYKKLTNGSPAVNRNSQIVDCELTRPARSYYDVGPTKVEIVTIQFDTAGTITQEEYIWFLNCSAGWEVGRVEKVYRSPRNGKFETIDSLQAQNQRALKTLPFILLVLFLSVAIMFKLVNLKNQN
jgi:hypothetical protein